METTEAYVREELAKDVAGILQVIDDMKEDLLKVNSDLIPEDQLPLIAKSMKGLHDNIAKSRLLTIIAGALSKES